MGDETVGEMDAEMGGEKCNQKTAETGGETGTDEVAATSATARALEAIACMRVAAISEDRVTLSHVRGANGRESKHVQRHALRCKRYILTNPESAVRTAVRRLKRQ